MLNKTTIHRIVQFIFTLTLILMLMFIVQLLCHAFMCPQQVKRSGSQEFSDPTYPWYKPPKSLNPAIPPTRIVKWKTYMISST